MFVEFIKREEDDENNIKTNKEKFFGKKCLNCFVWFGKEKRERVEGKR